MAKSKATEIMDSSINREQSRITEIMGDIKANELTHSHITIGTIIGDGYVIKKIITENTGEATVFTCTKNNEQFVAKVYHKDKNPKIDIVSNIKSIDSPYVIKILEDGEIQGRYYEILPFYINGDLQNNLPDIDFIRNVFIPSINDGLRAIHEKGIIHRDIKPNNMFYSDDKQSIVIGDFGISSQIDEGMSYRLTSTSRTAGYAAPETYSGIVSKEADYYSLGITLLHLLLQGDPFAGLSDEQIYIMTYAKRLEIPSHIDKNISMLIKGLTLKDRTNRWGYDEIKRWLKNEYVEINEGIWQEDSIAPYKFIDNDEYTKIEDLMIAFAQNWEEGKKHLYRGYLKRHIEDNFQVYGASILSKVEDSMEEENQDLGIFRLIYDLNPDAPLCWKGKIYKGMDELIDDALNEIKQNSYSLVYEILSTDILYYYFIVKKLMDDANIIKYIKEKSNNTYECLSNLIFQYRPAAPMIINGNSIATISELKEFLAKSFNKLKGHTQIENSRIKSDIIILLKNGILHGKAKYSMKNGDTKTNKFLNWLRDISRLARTNPDTAFWRFYFGITDNKTFYYMGNEIKGINEMIDFIMTDNAAEIINKSETIMNDPYFKEWTRTLGFEIKN